MTISRRSALLELAFLVAWAESFIWIWNRAFPHSVTVLYLVGIGFTLATHIVHRESPQDLGLRLDNLWAAARDAALPTVPLVLLFLGIGWSQGRLTGEALSLERFMKVAAWGFLQQYLLQSFIHRRLAVILGTPRRRELAVAGLFALFHLPNPWLTAVTFLAGYVFAVLYRRHPNLAVLALCHALGSTAVAFGLGSESLHKMRVGPGYFRA